METIASPEFWFYFSVTVAGAMGGLCRTLRDPDYKSLRNLLGIVGSSGLLALGVVSYLNDSSSHEFVFQVKYIGLAGLLGLLGKEPDYIIKLVIRNFLNAAESKKEEKKE